MGSTRTSGTLGHEAGVPKTPNPWPRGALQPKPPSSQSLSSKHNSLEALPPALDEELAGRFCSIVRCRSGHVRLFQKMRRGRMLLATRRLQCCPMNEAVEEIWFRSPTGQLQLCRRHLSWSYKNSRELWRLWWLPSICTTPAGDQGFVE